MRQRIRPAGRFGFIRRAAGCLALLIAAGTLPAGPATAAEETEIRVSVALPATHPVVAGGWQAFQAAADANGRADLRFRLFVNGAVIGSERALKGLAQGEADMGFVAPADYPDEFPHAAFLTALPMSGRDGMAAAAALTELVLLHCPPCIEEFSRKNLVFLGTYSAAPYLLLCKEPIADAVSLAGRKVWTPGSLWDVWARDMGAHPTTDGRDPAEALAKGGADAVVDVAMALRQPALAKQAKAVTALPLGAYRGASPFTANRDFWRRLTPAQRGILLEAAPAGIVAATMAYAEQAEQMLAAAAERGVELVKPAPDLVSRVAAFTRESGARTAENAESRLGLDGATRLLEIYHELYGKYLGMLESAGTPEAKTAVLTREIFARVNPIGYGFEDDSIAADTIPLAPREDAGQ